MVDFIDPDDVLDTFVTGCAWIEPLGHGMVRMWAYADEQGEKVVRAKLVLPVSRAREINKFIRDELHRLTPLRLIK